MSPLRIAKLIILAALIALVVWVANNTYWGEAEIPTPLKGEAARNPFYAVQKFADALGAQSEVDKVLTTPDSSAVLFVTNWNWGLSTQRRERMKQWVESGGRLVVDRSLISGSDDFEDWSGIGRLDEQKNRKGRKNANKGSAEPKDPDESDDSEDSEDPGEEETVFVPARLQPCRTLDEQSATPVSGATAARHFSVCGVDRSTSLTSRRKPVWALRDDTGIQVVRINIGHGSVTLINGMPFRYRDLFEGDHGALFVAMTQLKSGDEIHFLSEQEQATLLALTWRYGAPVVVLFLAFLASFLWRGSVRFGPPVAATETARRSLAEQIRGTGQFAMRFGGGEALHAAAERALKEAASRRISGYERLPSDERVRALARFTGFDSDSLGAAINYTGARRANELRSAIALLEAARRRIVSDSTQKAKHGN
jgi:hypothetical protein